MASHLQTLPAARCRSRKFPIPVPEEFGQGLLWKVSKEDLPSSYVFGTIHVAERHVSAQLDKVRDVLADSEIFVMEAVPEPDEIALFRQMMFFADGTRLQDVISADLYEPNTCSVECVSLDGERRSNDKALGCLPDHELSG